MAKIDSFNNPKFYIDRFINVSDSVGKNAKNQWGDVLVVQALLKYGLEGNGEFSGLIFPVPNGRIDEFTIETIKKYQQSRRKYFGHFTVDGRIDTAKRKGIKWTIKLLNGTAFERWMISGQQNENYMLDVIRTFPQLRAAIPNVPVGTFGFTLEPSQTLVGTLNLGLE